MNLVYSLRKTSIQSVAFPLPMKASMLNSFSPLLGSKSRLSAGAVRPKSAISFDLLEISSSTAEFSRVAAASVFPLEMHRFPRESCRWKQSFRLCRYIFHVAQGSGSKKSHYKVLPDFCDSFRNCSHWRQIDVLVRERVAGCEFMSNDIVRFSNWLQAQSWTPVGCSFSDDVYDDFHAHGDSWWRSICKMRTKGNDFSFKEKFLFIDTSKLYLRPEFCTCSGEQQKRKKFTFKEKSIFKVSSCLLCLYSQNTKHTDSWRSHYAER